MLIIVIRVWVHTFDSDYSERISPYFHPPGSTFPLVRDNYYPPRAGGRTGASSQEIGKTGHRRTPSCPCCLLGFVTPRVCVVCVCKQSRNFRQHFFNFPPFKAIDFGALSLLHMHTWLMASCKNLRSSRKSCNALLALAHFHNQTVLVLH